LAKGMKRGPRKLEGMDIKAGKVDKEGVMMATKGTRGGAEMAGLGKGKTTSYGEKN